MEQQTTLRDALDDAFESVETPEVDTRSRDEQGRFAPKQETTLKVDEQEPQEIAPAEPQEIQPVEVKTIPRPSSWKKDFEEDWGKLDPRMQDYINKREQDYAKGVSTYKNQYDTAQPIYEAMAQHVLPELQQHGILPQQWIADVAQAHKALANGNPQEKLNMLVGLARNYGVDLSALTGMPPDQNYNALSQELSQLRNQWNSFQASKQQQEQMELNNEIQSFASDPEYPHFETVRDTMAGLLQAGQANSLKEAYGKAIRLHDDLWNEMQAQQAQSQAQAQTTERQQKASQARAKAVSPKSANPTGNATGGTGKKSIRDVLAEQVESTLGGHI